VATSAAHPDAPRAVGAAHVLALSVAQYVLAFGASAIVARALGPEGRGHYYLPLLASTTAIAFGKLGVDQANIFLYGTSGVRLFRLSAQNGLIAAGCGSLLAAGLLLLPDAIPSIFGATPHGWLLIAALTIPFGIHAQLTGGLLAMSGGVRRQYVAGLISAAVQVGCAAAVFLAGAMTVAAALLLTFAGALVTWVVTVQPLAADRQNWIGADGALLRTTLRTSLVLYAGMILFFLHLRVDMYMVQGWLGAAALGQYSIAVTLAETLMMATDAVAVAVLPAQMNNTVRESAQRAIRAARINLLLGTGLAAVAALLSAPAIVILYGDAYRAAVLPMIVLLPGIVSLGMQRVCGAPTLRTGRPLGIAGIYALTLTTNVALNVWLIPRSGLIGASIASSVSYILGAGIFLTWTSRLAEMPLSRALRFDAADVMSVSAAVRMGIAMIRGMLPPAREPL